MTIRKRLCHFKNRTRKENKTVKINSENPKNIRNGRGKENKTDGTEITWWIELIYIDF